MPKIEYSLYRVKLIMPVQGPLFGTNDTPQRLLLASLNEKPSAELRRDYIWHIGNIGTLGESRGYFAIGRTTLTTVAKFDDLSGNFVDEPGETSPYTNVVFDSSLGLIAIAKKARLAPTSKGLASALQRLLWSTETIKQNEVGVEIGVIPDPTGFIEHIISAYAVRRFAATFTGPNPFDADEYFQKPLSVYAKAANATGGRASIVGEDLDREVIEEVAKSSAATGNRASARLLHERGRGAVTVNMSGDPIRMVYEEDEHTLEGVAADMVNKYNRVRH